MVGVVAELSKQLLGSHKPEDCDEYTLVVDSLPIMTCTGRNRTGKVAPEIADKGYCSTKNQYYQAVSCTLSVWDERDICRSRIILSYPLHLKMTWQYSRGNVYLLLEARQSSRIRYTEITHIGKRRMRQKATSTHSNQGNQRCNRGREAEKQGCWWYVFICRILCQRARRGILQLPYRKNKYSKSLQVPVNGRATFTFDRQSRHRVYNVNF